MNAKKNALELMRPVLDLLSWTPCDGSACGERDVVRVHVNDARPQGTVAMTDAHRRLLMSIVSNPFYCMTEHAVALGDWNTAVMNRIVGELNQAGFLDEPFASSLGRKGNPSRFLRISEKGARFIGIDYAKCKQPGKGGFEHRLFADRIKRYLLRKGQDAIIEFCHNGKSVDVCELKPGGGLVAYEVELHPNSPHHLVNVEKDIRAGFEAVVVVAKTRQHEDRLTSAFNRQLSAELLDRVKVLSIADFAD